jgi:hypothetical protein
MKKIVSLTVLCCLSLMLCSQTQPPKKRIPVDTTAKISRIYNNYKSKISHKSPQNINEVLIIDTSNNKRDTMRVFSLKLNY